MAEGNKKRALDKQWNDLRNLNSQPTANWLAKERIIQ